jgi:hypothetical protein
MRKDEIILDSEKMAEFIYEALIATGYAPVFEEIEVVTDIVFDYLVSEEIIEDMDGEI